MNGLYVDSDVHVDVCIGADIHIDVGEQHTGVFVYADVVVCAFSDIYVGADIRVGSDIHVY
jgi:hypothetical protein